MKTRREVAAEKFLAGYNCAQSVLYAYAPEVGLDPDLSLKVPTGLGAGMARRGEVCGAVTGGILVMGLKYGRGEGQDRAVAEAAYLKTRELMARFEQKHGSCLCRALLEGCDLNSPEGQRYFKEHDLLHKTCVRCVESVVEILGDMIDRPSASAGDKSK